MLDVEEYVQLALHASMSGNPHASLMHLHEALRLEPRNARATYLLATQHVELGLAERGVKGLQAALELDPSLEIARFQLGFVLVNLQRPAPAREQFSQLVASKDLALSNYAAAMLAVIDGEPIQARQRISAGLACRQINRALSGVMKRLLDGLSGAEGPPPAASEDPPSNAVHLGAYGGPARSPR